MVRAVRREKEKGISIEIKEDVYGQLEAIAQKRGSKLEDEVAEAIKLHSGWKGAYSDDPLFLKGMQVSPA